MHHNDNLSIKQNSINKNHNGLDDIIHMFVPLRNEGEQLKKWGIGRLVDTSPKTLF
jgi:hypothetical protein